MPFNLLKKYPDLLELNHLGGPKKTSSLKGVFDRDFVERTPVKFKGTDVVPTPKEGEIALETLYSHLTTEVVDYKTKRREFEVHRSNRLHWVRFNIDCKNPKLNIFSVNEKKQPRTYIYCHKDKYVIVLEPKINSKGERYYFLLTAYHLRGRNGNKIQNKSRRRLPEVL